MSELDLLNLARAANANEVAWFSQMITVTFAMIIAIYYFLNGAKMTLKVFGFVAYMIGMLMLLGQMLIEANVKAAAIDALRALPRLSAPAQQYVQVVGSWLGIASAVLFNVSFWILWLGTFYLLFFWQRQEEQLRQPGRVSAASEGKPTWCRMGTKSEGQPLPTPVLAEEDNPRNE